MAPAAIIAHLSVAEYLATTYRPDRDYIDGEVSERNGGETLHSGLIAYLGALFRNNKKHWGLRAYVMQRLQISPTRIRVADVCAERPNPSSSGMLCTP